MENIDRLTPRQAEIAALVFAGGSQKEIALALHISLHTIKVHTTTIRIKLRVPRRVSLREFYLMKQLEEPRGV